jgi:serine/threonine-protein kinase
MYLREVGAITDAKAEEILSASAPNRMRRGQGDRRMLRQMWAVQGGLGALAVVAGLGIQGFAGRLGGDPDQFAAESGAPVVPQRAGQLRFVVDPWAHVEIDGQEVLTTPSARLVALPPGRHFLRLANPYFASVDREVWVREGETQVIEETLAELPAEGEGETAP